jgi:hypothetical protein
MEHCAFLQQFPTINYYLAAQLLGSAFLEGTALSLREFIAGLPHNHNALMASLQQFNADSATAAEISSKFLEPFYTLLMVHSGLEMALGGGGISVDVNPVPLDGMGASSGSDPYHTPQMQREVAQPPISHQQHEHLQQLRQQQQMQQQNRQQQQHQYEHGQQYGFDDSGRADIPVSSDPHSGQSFYGAPAGYDRGQSSFIAGCQYEDDDDDDDYSGHYNPTNPPPPHHSNHYAPPSTEHHPRPGYDNRCYQRY